MSAGPAVLVRPAAELAHALSRSAAGRVILWLAAGYLLVHAALAASGGGALIGMIALIPLAFATVGTWRARRERAAKRSRRRALLFGLGLIAVLAVMTVVGVLSLLRRRRTGAETLDALDVADVERLARAEAEDWPR